jgi:integrase
MMKDNDIKINHLNSMSDLDENTVVTRTSTGEPRSYIFDDDWDYSGERNISVVKNCKVKFTAIKVLEHRRNIQKTLHKIKSNNGDLSVGKLKSIVSNLHRIYKIIGHTDWYRLSDDVEWRKLKNGLSGRYVRGSLENYNATLNRLVSNGFIDRYIEPNEIRYLNSTHINTQQHIAIPIYFYQKILSSCIKTIEIYHSYRYEISDVMAKAYELKSNAEHNNDSLREKSRAKNLRKSITESATRKVKLKLIHNIPEFILDFTGEWITNILTQCIIVCALFSGARIGEILSFNKNSYTTKKTINGEISIIQGITTKGNGGEAKIATWQCHPIVKDALELAYDMTEFAREIYKDDVSKLFDDAVITNDEYNRGLAMLDLCFISIRKNKKRELNYILPVVSVKTNKFLSKLGLKATLEDVEEFDLLNETRVGQLKLNGTLPKLTPHDFRRSFAVFMKRNGLGNDQTIKFQYKHDNIQMAEYYGKNAELARMHDILLDEDLIALMEEEGIRMGIDAYDEIFNKSNHLSGVEGERILNEKFNAIKSGHRVYMSRSEINTLVRNGSLSIVMLPTGGYCTNANCERLCGIKEFIAEKSVCQYKVVTDRSAKQQAKYRERLIQKFNALNNGDEVMSLILSGLKQSILSIEPTLLTHEITYEPFTAKIKGCYAL